MDADEASGLADAIALGQVLQDRDGRRFGELTAVKRRVPLRSEKRARQALQYSRRNC